MRSERNPLMMGSSFTMPRASENVLVKLRSSRVLYLRHRRIGQSIHVRAAQGTAVCGGKTAPTVQVQGSLERKKALQALVSKGLIRINANALTFFAHPLAIQFPVLKPWCYQVQRELVFHAVQTKGKKLTRLAVLRLEQLRKNGGFSILEKDSQLYSSFHHSNIERLPKFIATRLRRG